MSHVKIKRNNFNPAYFPYLFCWLPVQIFFGGSSSGKSRFLAQRCVLDVIRYGRNYLIVRNVQRTIRGSTFNEIKQVIRKFCLSNHFHVRESDLVITCTDNGAQILFAGLDDVEKLKSIVPDTGVITDIWIEEATETKESALDQLRLRLRGRLPGGKPKRIILSFNPIMRRHWIYKLYFSGRFGDNDKVYKSDSLLILRTTYKDNRFLDECDIEIIESYNVPGKEYYWEVYGLGKWGTLGDIIFTNWRVENLSSIKADLQPVRNGLDFGFINPTAVVRVCLQKDNLYVLEEPIYERRLTNKDISDMLAPAINTEAIKCDSAEPKSIKELQGFGTSAVKCRKRGRANSGGKQSYEIFCIRWMWKYNIIVDPACQGTINELSTYQWQKDKNGESIEQPVDENNHAIKAIWYALDTEMYGSGILV